jgi:restriction endonuclease S subunit
MVVENYKPRIEIDPAWEMVELGKVFSKETSSVFPPNLKSHHVNYVGLENISQGTGELDGNVVHDPKEIKSNKTNFQPKNILYGKLRPNLNKVYFAEMEGICSTDIIVLIPKRKVEPKFFFNHFLSDSFNCEVLKGLKGAQLPRIGFDYLSSILIPCPPLMLQYVFVMQIETERTLVNANKELIKIFEQKINDVIYKVWQGKGKRKQFEEREEELSMVAEG